MNYYLNKQVEWFEKTKAIQAATHSERHKAILETYILHVGYELVGNADRLFQPDMMVENPYYKILGLGSPTLTEFRGKEAIKKRFYDNLNEAVVLVYDETLAVADWGLAMFATVGTIVSAYQLVATGAKVDDMDSYYALEHFCAERWPFDERARLMAEEVFQIGDTKISKVAPEDNLTTEERNVAVRRFLPS